MYSLIRKKALLCDELVGLDQAYAQWYLMFAMKDAHGGQLDSNELS